MRGEWPLDFMVVYLSSGELRCKWWLSLQVKLQTTIEDRHMIQIITLGIKLRIFSWPIPAINSTSILAHFLISSSFAILFNRMGYPGILFVPH
jgi:hypothetical protein